METTTIECVALGTKMAVAFVNIFMARIQRQILSQSCIKPLFWKRYIDDVFSFAMEHKSKQNRGFCEKGK